MRTKIPYTSEGWGPFEVPAGAPVHSMGTGQWHTSKRKQTVWPFSVREGDGWTIITWPGQGGYWRRVCLRGDEFVAGWPFSGSPTWDKVDEMEERHAV